VPLVPWPTAWPSTYLSLPQRGRVGVYHSNHTHIIDRQLHPLGQPASAHREPCKTQLEYRSRQSTLVPLGHYRSRTPDAIEGRQYVTHLRYGTINQPTHKQLYEPLLLLLNASSARCLAAATSAAPLLGP
jgi:hypothetical protein